MTVIVPTRDRPVMLARAVRSIIGQSYPGEIECVIVFDQSDPAQVNVELPPGRRVRLVTNTRTPGAAGARNTGIMASDGPLVAFCDDDDAWDPSKGVKLPNPGGDPDQGDVIVTIRDFFRFAGLIA